MGMAAAEAQFHVLAVDDSLIDRKLIERLLKTSSYQVTTVDSGSKALEFLGWKDAQRCNNNDTFLSPKTHQEVEVNLVITDYCMPEMTGYDLLKTIKESSVLKNIPVVIMSSENVPSRINRCLQEGAEEFFLKPVRLSDVNKLRPHMVKAKCCNHFDDDHDDDDNQIPNNNNKNFDENPEKNDDDDQEQEQEPKLLLELQSQQASPKSQSINSNNNNGNKRKPPVDEGLQSPERTRARYSDITVLSS